MSDEHPPVDDELEIAPLESAETFGVWEPWTDATVRIQTFGDRCDPPLTAFAADTIYDMMGHGSDRTDREVGGVLLGSFVETGRGLMTRVEDILIADSNEASLTHVTFIHDAWALIHESLDKREDDLRIVGWYHTHPGFGPFLSAHDRFIHENFFRHPLQVALVLDPVQRLVAVFGWRGEHAELMSGCLLYDDVDRQEELVRILADFKYAADHPPRPHGILSWFSRK